MLKPSLYVVFENWDHNMLDPLHVRLTRFTPNRKQFSDSAEAGTDYTNIPENFPDDADEG